MLKPESLVHSLVLYEWANDLDLAQAKLLFDKFATEVGVSPFDVTVSNVEKFKTYKFSWFNKREILDQPNDWTILEYNWLREKGVLSTFSIDCGVSLDHRKHMSFHVDEFFVPHAKDLMHNWMLTVTSILDPVYGYLAKLAYGLQPREYVLGYGFGAPNFEIFDHQRKEFGYVFGSKESHLDRRFRDIYPVNIISYGHLALKVGEQLLPDWISKGHRGTLRKTGDNTWLWQLNEAQIYHVRKDMLSAGHLIVTA